MMLGGVALAALIAMAQGDAANARHPDEATAQTQIPDFNQAAECLGAFYDRGGFSAPQTNNHVVVNDPSKEEYQSNRGVNRIRLLARSQGWDRDKLTEAASSENYGEWKRLTDERDAAVKSQLFQALVDETDRCEGLLTSWSVSDSSGDHLISSKMK